MNRNAPPRLLLWLLPTIDGLIVRFSGIRAPREGSALRFSFHSFYGKPFTLPDGTRMRRGQRVAEMHLNNDLLRLGKIDIWRLMEETRRELRLLVGEVSSANNDRGIKAVRGVTVHHAAARRLGFSTRGLPSQPFNWLISLFLKGVLVTYHPQGRGRLNEGRIQLEVREIWMSSSELVRRYG